MKESLDKAKEELKRADHLIYVSLKYTRTVDVIKKKKIEQKPSLVTQKCAVIKKIFKEEKAIVKLIDLYLLLRKIDKAEFSREREYRRHVTMIVKIDGEIINVDIDLVYKYFDKIKEFMEYVEEKVS